MEQKYLILISIHGYENDYTYSDEVYAQLEEMKGELALQSITKENCPLLDLCINFAALQTELKEKGLSKVWVSLLSFTQEEDVFQVDKRLDALLRESASYFYEPTFTNSYYLVKDGGGEINFHQVSRHITQGEVLDDDFFDMKGVISDDANLFYKYLYGFPGFTDEEIVYVSKMLLVAGPPEGELGI